MPLGALVSSGDVYTGGPGACVLGSMPAGYDLYRTDPEIAAASFVQAAEEIE